MAQASPVISHIGVCTSDVDRSLRFYTEALGFELERSLDEIGAPFDTLMEMPGTRIKVHYVKSGGVTVELIGYLDGEVTGSAERRSMNQLGFTHLTLIVDDIDPVAERIVDYGGRVYPETRVESAYGPIVFCTDPDGVRIELFQAAG